MWETLHKAVTLLGQVPAGYVAMGIGLYALGLLTASVRWRVILTAAAAPVGLADTALTLLASFFVNNITPARIGGEVCRVVLIRRKAGIDLKRATLSVAYDRLMDVVPVAVLAALSLPTLRLLVKDLRGYLVGVIAVVAVGLALACGYRYAGRLRDRISSKISSLRGLRIGRRALGIATGLSFLNWALDVLRLMVVAAAFGVSLDPYQAATLSLLAVIGGLVPTLGGVGAVEGGLTAALCFYGVSVETALAITLLERSISYLLSTLAGGVVVLAMGGRSLLRLARSPSAVGAAAE